MKLNSFFFYNSGVYVYLFKIKIKHKKFFQDKSWSTAWNNVTSVSKLGKQKLLRNFIE